VDVFADPVLRQAGNCGGPTPSVLCRPELMSSILLILYFFALTLLSVLGLHRLFMAVVALRAGRNAEPVRTALGANAPTVLVQLPLYNESLVAERLLQVAGALRYPEGRWCLQVLDDSTDETRRVVDRTAAALLKTGVPIEVVRRSDRKGYKAGALAYGLQQSSHECVAIFDADFMPEPDFLERTVPELVSDPQVGLVQARWGHDNRNASWLTRAQAIFLDGHFGVEHTARAALGHFFNFHGTAGVWRRSAIDEAGGWRDVTITEDLDLSYRAQLKGWRFRYLDAVIAPAELPDSWVAFRTQQARWVKGSVETARLLMGPVFRANLPWNLRFDAAVHLCQNFAYPLMALLATLLPAAVILRDQLGWRVPGGQPLLSVLDLSMLGVGTFAMLIFYGVAVIRSPGGASFVRGIEILFALCVGAGMSLTNTAEVISGLRSEKSEFVRTPKQGSATRQLAQKAYRSPVKFGRLALELIYLAYFGVAIVYALQWSLWGAMPFLLMYAVGFLAVSFQSLKEVLRPIWQGAVSTQRSEA
jgi:cellulose synthase/poly-beta-1,6-N-acetylglucosamine synthase-like glycosyltransferase